MEKHHWLHRINHVGELSYPLLDAGYLSYGWQKLCDSDLHRQVQGAETDEKKWEIFDGAMRKKDIKSRSRFSLWRFLQFDCGDLVIVPKWKAFDVYRVKGKAFPVVELAGKPPIAGLPETVELTDAGFRNKQTGRIYDLGYLVEVEEVKRGIPRSFAQSALVSRMKTQKANAQLDDLKEEVEAALRAEEDGSFHEKAIDGMREILKNTLSKHLDPWQLQKLVAWYFEKKGASRVYIPAPNERWKKNGADADVIAEFTDFRVIFCVQVKKHKGETGEWGVTQIKEYVEQMPKLDGYTYIPWVLSTAEVFSEEAEDLASEEGIRLVPGDEFMEMLLDCGIDTVDQAFEKHYPTN